MKFRYKVLMINMLILSVGLSIIGFFMIRKNYELALNNQIKTAIDENNLFQSSIEYALLERLSAPSADFTSELISAADSVVLAYSQTSNTQEFVVYDKKLLYKNIPADINLATNNSSTTSNKSTTNNNAFYPEQLIENAVIGEKYYLISEENGNHYIYVTSCNVVYEKNMNIIIKRDISDIYSMMNEQQIYFSFLLIVTLILCSVFMLMISYLLTKPLEELNRTAKQFGEGNYEVRSKVNTRDEVGTLSNTYNSMAASVEEHVNELNNMIERQNQFVADFTHEIKTPMTSIIGYADTIRSKELPRETQILAASYIFSEGKRLETMSQKLFDFILLKHHTISKKEFPVSHLFETVKQSVSPMLETKNITLEILLENDYTLNGDLDLLKSALINLIDNARKASKEHTTIKLIGSIVPEDNYKYSISVVDEGTGIPKEHLDKICNEFYMVDKSRSRKEGGAGLGLSLAYVICQSHEFDFFIESKEHFGTTITIRIP